MLITKEVKVTCLSNNKLYIESLGLEWKYKKVYTIDVHKLLEGSSIGIECLCDYCLEEGIETIIPKSYYKYINSHKNQLIIKDACEKHKHDKQVELCLLKKGVKSSVKLPDIHEKIVNSIRKNNIDLVRKEFEERNLILLTKEYYNPDDYMEFICPSHKDKGIQSIRYGNFKYKNQGCKYCSYDKLSQQKRLDFSIVQEAFKQRKYILISTKEDYINSNSKLKYICPLHKNIIQEISYNNLVSGSGCSICAIENNSGENNHNWKGGRSSLYEYLRNCIVDWKKESMINCNYKCVLTNQRFDTIHHLYGFDLIVEEILSENNLIFKQSIFEYEKDELEILKNQCIEKHKKYNGVCIINSLHVIFHKNYGFGRNTPEQFEEFTQRYKNFEFDYLLDDNYKYCNVLKGVS